MNDVVEFPINRNSRGNCSQCAQAPKCLPDGLSASQIRQFEQAVSRKRVVQRGSHIYFQDDGFSTLYLLTSGSVKVYSLDGEGEEQVLGFFFPGDVLALDGIGDGHHHSNAVTLETSTLCELSFVEFEKLTHETTLFQTQLTGLLSHEIARDHALLQLLGKKNAEQRLAGFLLELSARFSARGFSASDFQLSMSRQDIGAYLGLALETVSRLLSRLQQQNVLSVNRRNVVIRNESKLRSIAGITAPQGVEQRQRVQ